MAKKYSTHPQLPRDRQATQAEITLFRTAMGDVVKRESETSEYASFIFNNDTQSPRDFHGNTGKRSVPEQLRKTYNDSTFVDRATKATKSLRLNILDDLDRRTSEKFRRGRMPIEAILDLHGLTQTQAEPVLSSFLGQCQAKGFRCVMVVTGKGKRSRHEDGSDHMRGRYGILRESLLHWLNVASNRSHILAIHTAQRHHGGSGAFYILLKRRRAGRTGTTL